MTTQYTKKFLNGDGVKQLWDAAKGKFTLYSSEGIQIEDNFVKVLYDEKTLVLDSEGNLKTQVGGYLGLNYTTTSRTLYSGRVNARGSGYHEFMLSDAQKALSIKSWGIMKKYNHNAKLHVYGYRGTNPSLNPFDKWYDVEGKEYDEGRRIIHYAGSSAAQDEDIVITAYERSNACNITFRSSPELLDGNLTFDLYLWEPCDIVPIDGRFIPIDDTLELTSEGLHVRIDGETIQLTSEGLLIPIDGITLRYDAENNWIEATGLSVEAGDAIEVVSSGFTSEGDPIKKINVLFDKKTIVLDSEGKLQTKIGGWAKDPVVITDTLLNDASGTQTGSNVYQWSLPAASMSKVVDRDSFGTLIAGAIEIGGSWEEFSEDAFVLNKTSESPKTWQTTIGGGAFGISIVYDSANNTYTLTGDGSAVPYTVTGAKLTVKLDVNEEEEIHYVNNKFIKIDENTLELDSEGALKVINSGTANADEKTIVTNSEGFIETAIGGSSRIIQPFQGVLVDSEDVPTAAEPEFIFELDDYPLNELRDVDSFGYSAVLTLTTNDSVVHTEVATGMFNVADRGNNYTEWHASVGYLQEPLRLYSSDGDTTFIINTYEYDPAHAVTDVRVTLSINYSGDEIISYIGTRFINIDNKTLVEGLASETDTNTYLKVNLDNSTLVCDSESNKIKVNADGETIIINSEGKLSVQVSTRIDEKTIVRNELDQLSVPFDYNTIYISSEGKVETLRYFLNDVDLSTNPTTQGAKITWYGTQAEYDALLELNDNTIYIIDDSTSEGGVSPSMTSYNSLNNKPQINGVTLTGNRRLAELGIQGEIINGTAIEVANNVFSVKYRGGVLSVNGANELFADTYTREELDEMLASSKVIISVTELPTTLVANATYYVGPNSEGTYDIWLCDRYRTLTHIGQSTTARGAELRAGDCLTIEGNIMNANRAISINSEGTDNQLATPKAVYDFVYQGCTSTTDGKRGIVPAPVAGQEGLFLRGDGVWATTVIPDPNDVEYTEIPISIGTLTGTISFVRKHDTVTVYTNLHSTTIMSNQLLTTLDSKLIPPMPLWRLSSDKNGYLTIATNGKVYYTATTTSCYLRDAITYVV